MTEKSSATDLKNAALVDPFQIGREVTAASKKLKIPLPFAKRSLTENETSDLLKIDPGTVTIDDIKEYATSHIIYYESMGRVRLKPFQEKDFKEAKTLNSWLSKGEYPQAAAFFLQKAKDEWRGTENATDFGEQRTRIFEMEDVATIPWSVTRQGDTAIKQFLDQQNLGMTLRMAGRDSAMYLRQAAVLAGIIGSS